MDIKAAVDKVMDDYCITQLKKRLDDTRREINSLEATHKTLLNPDFWQPHLERENA